MLLIKLQSREKFAFLQLAHYLARIDNDFGEDEKGIIAEYCNEMGIENIDFDINSFNLEDTLKQFKSKESKKIVVLELMILAHIDKSFHINEQVLIDKIAKYFEISTLEVNNYSAWGKSVAALYEIARIYIESDILKERVS